MITEPDLIQKTSVVFFGTPDFAAASLEALFRAGLDIKAVVTAPDRPSGRGLKPRPSEVKQMALELGLDVLQPEKLKEPEFLRVLSNLKADIYAVVAFRMLPAEVWKLPSKGCFNLHASLLPDYRGAAPIHHALLNGDEQTGLSTFLIDERIDTGSILLQRIEPIEASDNLGSLYDRLKTLGSELVVETAELLASGKAVPKPQQSGGNERPAPKIEKHDSRLRFDQSAEQCHNRVRAFAPSPGAWFEIFSADLPPLKVKVLESRWVETDFDGAENWEIEKGKLAIRCTRGRFFPLRVQPEDRKPMPIEAFLNGYRTDSKTLIK